MVHQAVANVMGIQNAKSSVVAVYRHHADAEEAVHMLRKSGIAKDQALKYQSRLEAREFLVTGTQDEIQLAKEILQNFAQLEMQTYEMKEKQAA